MRHAWYTGQMLPWRCVGDFNYDSVLKIQRQATNLILCKDEIRSVRLPLGYRKGWQRVTSHGTSTQLPETYLHEVLVTAFQVWCVTWNGCWRWSHEWMASIGSGTCKIVVTIIYATRDHKLDFFFPHQFSFGFFQLRVCLSWANATLYPVTLHI